MKIKFAILSLIGLGLFAYPQIAFAEGLAPGQPAALCLPGVYQKSPENCLALGPSNYLTRMADVGIIFPLQGLPAS